MNARIAYGTVAMLVVASLAIAAPASADIKIPYRVCEEQDEITREDHRCPPRPRELLDPWGCVAESDLVDEGMADECEQYSPCKWEKIGPGQRELTCVLPGQSECTVTFADRWKIDCDYDQLDL